MDFINILIKLTYLELKEWGVEFRLFLVKINYGILFVKIISLIICFVLLKIKKTNFNIGILFVLADVLIFLSGERTFVFLNLSTIFIII